MDAILTLRSRVAWAHDFNTDRFASATFQMLPGASFVVNGAAQARDVALTTASAEMKWTNEWAVAGTFEGEFSDVTRSYAGKAVVRYDVSMHSKRRISGAGQSGWWRTRYYPVTSAGSHGKSGLQALACEAARDWPPSHQCHAKRYATIPYPGQRSQVEFQLAG
jgi:hypothetical protein